jgi:murein DD-endopeptidase MepM/ murein hydrolase activator NlpD
MLAASLMLGGLLPLSNQTCNRWAPSGAWRLPVGDAYQITSERPSEPGPFYVLRSVERDGDHVTHQGADLGNGSLGAIVRAAAAGVVVRAADHGDYGGYGSHIVLAHRLPGGALVYSVYAHLRLTSLRVRAGQQVQAGQALGRVGATGHVTGPHLHFEVRTTGDPAERWEFASIVDPLVWVEERLPTHRADTTGTDAFLEWAECAAMLAPGAGADDALTHEAWWRMLAVAARGPLLDPALEANALRDSLIAARVLPADHRPASAVKAVTWRELARDLGRARMLGVRTGHGPLHRAHHRTACAVVLGTSAPTARLSVLSARTDKPTIAQAVLLLADLGGPRPVPAKPLKPKPRPKPVRHAPSPLPIARPAAPHAPPSIPVMPPDSGRATPSVAVPDSSS